MKFTETYSQKVATLFADAKNQLMANMESQGIGAILWNVAAANFHFIPEVSVSNGKRKQVKEVEGLYVSNGSLYLIIKGECKVSVADMYNASTEVNPVAVRLNPEEAAKKLGSAATSEGFTQEGSLEEWLAIADCYFEALAMTAV